MYFLPAGLMTAANAGLTAHANLTWIGMWTSNIILVTIGNIVGAMFFVAFLYWLGFKRELEAL